MQHYQALDYLFLIIGSKNTEWLLLGAFIAAWIATIMVNTIHRNSRIKYDSALGMTLAVFFGFGLVLLTYIQKNPPQCQSGRLREFSFRSGLYTITAGYNFNGYCGYY